MYDRVMFIIISVWPFDFLLFMVLCNVNQRSCFPKKKDENKNWFVEVQRLTEDAYEKNDRQRVTFIAHSMGGLMVQQFLQQMTTAWKDTYVQQIITLSAPWGGSVQSLQALSVGYDFRSTLLSNYKMKEVQETCPSLVWLLPSTFFWKSYEILIRTNDKEYTMDNMGDFFKWVTFIIVGFHCNFKSN